MFKIELIGGPRDGEVVCLNRLIIRIEIPIQGLPADLMADNIEPSIQFPRRYVYKIEPREVPFGFTLVGVLEE